MHNKTSPVEQPVHPFVESLQAMERAIARAKASSKGDKTVDAAPISINKCMRRFLDSRMLILDIDLQILKFKNQLSDVSTSDRENISRIQTEIALLQSLANQAHLKKSKYASELSQVLNAHRGASQA